MRIQEHLFQGFFGIKKKKDSAKYYHECVDKLKGLDADLDKCIEEFQKILANHNKKINAYQYFLTRLDAPSMNSLRDEVKKLEGMFDEDDIANDAQRRYASKIEDLLREFIKNDENSELKSTGQDTINDLKELLRMIEHIKPLWQRQIDFMDKSNDEIIDIAENIKELTAIFKEESQLLRMEESLLKKIDLKTGNILRKTSLKLWDIEDTKDMNMRYREIKHIR